MLFKAAREAHPCCIVIEEFEVLATRRGLGSTGSGLGNSLQSRVLATLLNELDGISSDRRKMDKELFSDNSKRENTNSADVMCIVTTTTPSLLDEALLRHGRLEHSVHLTSPTITQLEDIVTVVLKDMPYHRLDLWDIHRIAKRIHHDGGAAAEVRSVIDRSRMVILEEMISEITVMTTIPEEKAIGEGIISNPSKNNYSTNTATVTTDTNGTNDDSNSSKIKIECHLRHIFSAWSGDSSRWLDRDIEDPTVPTAPDPSEQPEKSLIFNFGS